MKRLFTACCLVVTLGIRAEAASVVIPPRTVGCLLLAAGGAFGSEIERRAYETFADLAVKLPPELRTCEIESYSTNTLDFALNNGLAMTKGGRLWASWIAGGDGPDSFTVANWSDDGGETWTDVKMVIDGHNGTITSRTNIIGTFWLDPDGRFHCFTDQSIGHFDGRAGVWEAVCENPDVPSPRWSAARRLCDGHVINKPIVLRNGHWAMSAYLNGTWKRLWDWSPRGTYEGAFPELDAKRGAICLVSSDGGKTWEERGVVRFPSEDRKTHRVIDWQESQLLESSDGRTLRVFARVADGQRGCLMSAESTDEGRTWTEPHLLPGMDNTNARFQIMRLQSGRILFVKHGAPGQGTEVWQGREKLTAYLSDDDGATWKGALLLDAGCGSYPDCCQGPDGMIYVSHDRGRGTTAEIWMHRFTEEDVLAGKIVSPRGKLNLLVSRAMASAHNKKLKSGKVEKGRR